MGVGGEPALGEETGGGESRARDRWQVRLDVWSLLKKSGRAVFRGSGTDIGQKKPVGIGAKAPEHQLL